jgi:hypothetical protein
MLLADEAHFQKLVTRPLYQKAESSGETSPLLQRLCDLARHTSYLLAGPEQNWSEDELRLLAGAFLALFRIDPDACLGYPRLAPLATLCLNHSLHVLFITALLAEQMDFSEAQSESLAAAALTMNIADMPLQERLQTQLGYASAEDWVKLREHPTDAAAMLERAGVSDSDWLDNVRQHHENLDGSGYPARLSGMQISLAARILRVADVYCTKINAPHYHPPTSARMAFQELFGHEHSHLDTQIGALLLRRIGLFPPGTLVRLANRETACITRLGRNGHVRLAVSFMDARGHMLEMPRDRDLETRTYVIHSRISPDPAWPPINWPRLWGY